MWLILIIAGIIGVSLYLGKQDGKKKEKETYRVGDPIPYKNAEEDVIIKGIIMVPIVMILLYVLVACLVKKM